MVVTICQLHDQGAAFRRDWDLLINEVRQAKSELIVLPQMPFGSSFLNRAEFSRERWDESVDAHDRAEARFADLEPAAVLGTRPVDFGNSRFEEGFTWSARDGFRGVHAQTRPEARAGVWESSWIEGATPDFVAVPVGQAIVGFLIGAEIWNREEARRYRHENVDLLVAPRLFSADIRSWQRAARESALNAAAYCASSARVDGHGGPAEAGHVFDPSGVLLAMTDDEHPVISLPLDLNRARAAKAALANS